MKVFSIIIVLLSSIQLILCQCPDNYTLSNNQDLADFIEQYPDCKNLNSLVITEKFDSANALNHFDKVGLLQVENYHLPSLDISPFKTSSLILRNNTELYNVKVNLNGFIAASNIEISNCVGLDTVTIHGNLLRLMSIFNDDPSHTIFIRSTDSLFLAQDFFINGNVVFLGGKMRPTRSLQFFKNNSYRSFDEISEDFHLDSIQQIWIHNLNDFDTNGADKLSYIKTLHLADITDLDLNGFSTSSLYCENLLIRDCPNIVDFEAMENCTISNLRLTRLDNLLRCNGLNFRNNEIGSILLQENPLLREIDDLFEENTPPNDRKITFSIINNPLLDWCSYDLICNAIAETPDLVEISGNKGACEDIDAVATFCISADEEVAPITTLISIRDGVFYTTNDEAIHHYEVYNAAGRLLLSETHLDGKMAPTHTGILIISYTTVQGRRGHVKLLNQP